jgi:hypothetical protein
LQVKIVNDAGSQAEALKLLAKLIQRSIINQPIVRETALKIVSNCESKDDICELNAIYNAVKYGARGLPGFERGFKYVADPRWSDYFVAPHNTIKLMQQGANGGDCDDHTGLVCALAGALGFQVGCQAWGPSKEQSGEYVHVYAVVGLPKRDPNQVVGMDTTVPEAKVGWRPPYGHYMTAWLE